MWSVFILMKSFLIIMYNTNIHFFLCIINLQLYFKIVIENYFIQTSCWCLYLFPINFHHKRMQWCQTQSKFLKLVPDFEFTLFLLFFSPYLPSNLIRSIKIFSTTHIVSIFQIICVLGLCSRWILSLDNYIRVGHQ